MEYRGRRGREGEAVPVAEAESGRRGLPAVRGRRREAGRSQAWSWAGGRGWGRAGRGSRRPAGGTQRLLSSFYWVKECGAGLVWDN